RAESLELGLVSASARRERVDANDDDLVVVRLIWVSPGAERIVVVVGDEQVRAVERQDALDRHEREREWIAEPDVAWLSWERDEVGIVDVQQVEDGALDQEPVVTYLAEVDQVDLLELGRRALLLVALDHEQPIRVQLSHIAERVGRGVHVVLPGAPGVRAALD